MSAAFWALRQTPLHRLSAGEAEDFRQAMAEWLGSDDPAIRDAAVERLCMASFSRFGDAPPAPSAQQAALAFLLAAIGRQAPAHPDLIDSLLNQLRWHGDEDPFRAPLLAWLAALTPADPGQAARIEGARLLVDRRGRATADWLPLLDHPSDHVRACAAHALGEGLEAGEAPALLRRLREMEIARPGILGPLWGAWSPGAEDLPFDAAGWMLDIIAARRGPEPAGLPFNGLDFHLHELAGDNAAAVARLIALGEWATALLTATESDDPVPGMAPLLRRLGAHPEPGIARPAQAQLALVYAEAHPAADPARLRPLPGRFPGATGFALRQGDAAHWRDALVIHAEGQGFDDAAAWRLVDAALPPPLRGAPVAHPALGAEAAPGPSQHGTRAEHHAFASGALVLLRGDGGARRWQRLTVIGRGLQGRWSPFA
ncbi:hypothetical protein BKE38_20775 [Pseudoroseomonas deserti]|uniref:Uncharacterized protein n=1 Tax=Teichococcus deserti TaxID=1817963 RepID=A0A1V2GY60_9PROT|nr:hypothetical protein [Pseudoroseomonas deserti]ONG49512.1 hypothetical protein BKE38_20775 [Pseudoroseomonas deserti]